ncbi:MAG: hypothetical protein AB7O88_22170 [Reyranellaceae bacterium]
MRISACALAVAWALAPEGAGAQSASEADALRTAIETQDLMLIPDIPPMTGGHTTFWRFSPPDRVSIERWFTARADGARRWDPVWPGRYAFTDGKLCLRGDDETKPRCFSIERLGGPSEWRLADGKEVVRLRATDREKLSQALERRQR